MAAEGEPQQLAPTPNAKAATIAGPRQGGGRTLAGATIQKPVAASPETNEQFLLQAPLVSYHGLNGLGPLKSWVWYRPRPAPMVLKPEVDDQVRARSRSWR